MDMPHLVMEQVLDNVDFLTILNLRKVCKSFRNLIDDIKPINNLIIIRIYLEFRRIKVELVFDFEEVFVNFFLFYQEGPEENSCCIFKDFVEPEFAVQKDGHFVDAFLTDFEPILKNQRSKLTELEIKVNCFYYDDDYSFLSQSKPQSIFSRFLFKKFESVSTMTCIVERRQDDNIANEMIDGIWRILESRTVPLETGKLKLIVPKSSQVVRLLRSIKTNSLHGNRANQGASSPGDADLTLDSKCETFKTMEELVISKFYMGNPILDFLHIPKLNIIRDSIPREDILIIKQVGSEFFLIKLTREPLHMLPGDSDETYAK
ncbi:hypothetical protein B9Z55_026797 [Caenorhabditis nigoni]|nr:hypothetical protein B9Z55_026797 [Caenorhabditis nigoni]